MKNIFKVALILACTNFAIPIHAETGSGCETYSHVELKEKYHANFLNKDLQGCFSYSVDDGGIKSPAAMMTIRIGNNISSLNMATTAKIAYEAFTSIVNIQRANKILSDDIDQNLKDIRAESKNAAKQIENDLLNLDRAYSKDALPQLKQNQIDLKIDAQIFALKNSAFEKKIATLLPGSADIANPDSQIPLPKVSLDPISKEKERWSNLNSDSIPFRTLIKIKDKNQALAGQLLKEIKTERYNRLGLTHVENLPTFKEVQKYEKSENLYAQKLSLLKKNPEVLKNYDANEVQTIKEISREFKREADQNLVEGRLKEANDTLDLAHISLDIATSLPFIASGRGLYELYTGKSLIDGHQLTTTEVAIAGGMVLLDLTPVSVISRGAEIAGTLGKVGTQLVERGIIKAGFEEALNIGVENAKLISETAKELLASGNAKIETIRRVLEHKLFFSYLSQETYLASKAFQKDIISFEIQLVKLAVPDSEITSKLEQEIVAKVRYIDELVIKTPYGVAKQELSKEALIVRSQVDEGERLYRLGSRGLSQTGEGAQFWSLENPQSPDYASRYGIPSENIANANFIETATLKKDSPFITRIAPPVGSNQGGGVEVVVPVGGVNIEGHISL